MASSSQYLVIFELASSRNFLRIYDLNFCQFKKKERKKYIYISLENGRHLRYLRFSNNVGQTVIQK